MHIFLTLANRAVLFALAEGLCFVALLANYGTVCHEMPPQKLYLSRERRGKMKLGGAPREFHPQELLLGFERFCHFKKFCHAVPIARSSLGLTDSVYFAPRQL